MATKGIKPLKKISAEWNAARQELLENVKLQPFVSQHETSAFAKFRGQTVYLPAYIPYIGPKYFEFRPRVLCYAINQNLSPHVPWTKEWIAHWAADTEHAQDRLNRASQNGQAIPIRPYAEGFIPLLALIAIRRLSETYGNPLPQTIDDVIAVTNFVKFSTANDASSSSIPNSWWRECSCLYVCHEIQVLRPDIILCFGQKTSIELRRVLKNKQLITYKPELLHCRFPARIPSVKSRPLSNNESKTWNRDIRPLADRIREPKAKPYHKLKVHQFPGYFIDVVTSWGYSL